jgi:hypothetical protein
MLNEAVVPMAKQAAGFRSGVWTKTADGTKGASIEVFESEKDARAYADAAQAPPDAAVTFDSVEVMEVMASA